MSKQTAQTPFRLVIDLLEQASDSLAADTFQKMDWTNPETRIVRFQKYGGTSIDSNSLLDILIKHGSDRLVGAALCRDMFDGADMGGGGQAQTTHGEYFTRKGLWTSAFIESIQSNRIDVARRIMQLARPGDLRSKPQDIARIGSQNGQRQSFEFMLSDEFLRNFSIIRAPEEACRDEIDGLREQVIVSIALNAPLASLKTLARLCGGHLEPRLVALAAKNNHKPQRPFALAKLVRRSETDQGFLPPATAQLLAEFLVKTDCSDRVFSPRAGWLLANARPEQVDGLVDTLAMAAERWNDDLLNAIRKFKPCPGPLEMAQLLTKADDSVWLARLCDMDQFNGDASDPYLRDTLETIAENRENNFRRIDPQGAEKMARRLVELRGSDHGCRLFEERLVEQLENETGCSSDAARARITRSMMQAATRRATKPSGPALRF